MTHATVRRWMESEKGRERARAVVRLTCDNIAHRQDTNRPTPLMTIEEVFDYATETVEALDDAEGYEVQKAAQLMRDILGYETYMTALYRQASHACEMLIGALMCTRLYEQLTQPDAPIKEMGSADDGLHDPDPSKFALLQYESPSEYGQDLVYTAQQSLVVVKDCLSTINAHNELIGIVGDYYKIPSVDVLKNPVDIYEFFDDYHAERELLIDVLLKKYNKLGLFPKMCGIMDRCFKSEYVDSIIPSDKYRRKARAEIRKNDGRTLHYYRAFYALVGKEFEI